MVVHMDEAPGWNPLHARFEMKRINHQEVYSLDGASTNWAEEYFSRLRRAEIGHHHIAGAYCFGTHRRPLGGKIIARFQTVTRQTRVVMLALSRKASPDFTGYWQWVQSRCAR